MARRSSPIWGQLSCRRVGTSLDDIYHTSKPCLPGATLLAFVYAYVVGAKLLTKLGAPDLAMLAADRSAAASMEAGSLAARGLVAYHVARALLRAVRDRRARGHGHHLAGRPPLDASSTARHTHFM